MSSSIFVRDERVDIAGLQFEFFYVRKIIVRRLCARDKIFICGDFVRVSLKRLGFDTFAIITASGITLEKRIISISISLNNCQEFVLGFSESRRSFLHCSGIRCLRQRHTGLGWKTLGQGILRCRALKTLFAVTVGS